MVRKMGEGSGPLEVELEDEGGGEGDGEVGGASKAPFSPGPRMGCTRLVAGALRHSGRKGMRAFWG